MDLYFDANATTPLSADALKVWAEVSEKFWHNPSGLYPKALEAKRYLEALRKELAELMGCESGRIVFTSGATEANNAVLGHFSRCLQGTSRKAVISSIEHPCVADPARRLFSQDDLLEVGVSRDGVFDLASIESPLSEGSVGFVSLMAANNETGVLQPWLELAGECRSRNIPYHCDAAQWIGKLPLDELHQCYYLTASAHKFGGPVGVGFLVIPPDSTFHGQVGGPQERGYRGGTENLPAIAAMVAALKTANLANDGSSRDQFEKDLVECLPGVRVLGSGASRLGNTSMFVLPEHKNLKWLTRLGQRGIAVSTGSACSAGKGDPSRVMQAMGCSFEEMGRVLRVSGLPDAGSDDWEALLDGLLEVRDELNSPRGSGRGGIQKINLENLG